MNKILLIIQREYLSRVKKKSFLLTTFLVPVLIIGVYGLTIVLTKKSFENNHAEIQVIDHNGTIASKLEDNESITFVHINGDVDDAKSKLADGRHKGFLLIIPQELDKQQTIELFASEKAGISTQGEIKKQIETVLRNQQLEASGIDLATLESIRPKVHLTVKEMTADGEKESSTGAAMGLAMGLSVLIYISLFLYGSQVMRGIIEEKSNRIVEVIISSVKPFQLMMGKIIGIGLVGITQFLLWIILSGALAAGASFFFMNGTDIQTELQNISPSNSMATVQEMPSQQRDLFENVQQQLGTVDISRILITFFIFFLGGYLLYSALFAAVGSAVDNETETQQFMLPITMPLLFTYILSFGVLINDPNGTLALWLSMIPFTSPIAMMVRMPFGVPEWQIALSILLLIIGFVVTTWIAGRIYRVGILMYGKKPSYKELMKWFRYKG